MFCISKETVAVKASDNGDCLYNATSIALCGDESLALLLRLLVAGKLFFNSKYYPEHPVFCETSGDTDISVETLFSIALKCQAEKKFYRNSGQVRGSESSSVVYMYCWGMVIFLESLST